MKTYKELVTEAKNKIKGRQCGYPYRKKTKIEIVAEQLAKDCGEVFLQKVSYRHYYGTSDYTVIPSDSPCWEWAEKLPRGIFDFGENLKIEIAHEVKNRKGKRLLPLIEKIRNEEREKSDPWSDRAFWKLRNFHGKVREKLNDYKNFLSSRAFAYVCAEYEVARGVKPEQVSYHAYEHLDRNSGKPSEKSMEILKTLRLEPKLNPKKI